MERIFVKVCGNVIRIIEKRVYGWNIDIEIEWDS